MNPVDNDGGTPQQDEHAQGGHETSGFASVMARLKNSDAAEREALAARTETVVVGYEAYAIGQQHLARGAHAAAGRWLKIAARHGVPGAQQALAELAAHRTPPGVGQFTAHDGHAAVVVPSLDGSSHVVTPRYSLPKAADDRTDCWELVLDLQAGQEARAARAEAEQITLQAQRQSAEVLSQARTDAEQITSLADEQASEVLAQAKAEAATILAEAKHLREAAMRRARNAADSLAQAERLRERFTASRMKQVRDEHMAELLNLMGCSAIVADGSQREQGLGKAAAEALRPLAPEQTNVVPSQTSRPALHEGPSAAADIRSDGGPSNWAPGTRQVFVVRNWGEAQPTEASDEAYACRTPVGPLPADPDMDDGMPRTPFLSDVHMAIVLAMSLREARTAGQGFPFVVVGEEERGEPVVPAALVRLRRCEETVVTVYGEPLYSATLPLKPYSRHDDSEAEQNRGNVPATDLDTVRDWCDSAGVGTPSG